MARVIMIGLDAASLDFIAASRGALPNLARLLDAGVAYRLKSAGGDLFPASVWPSFYTATHPGEHGVYYPLQWDETTMSLRPLSDLLYCEPFWYDLERRGYRVTAVDVPVTWRSRLQRGVEITDWAPHEPMQGFSVQPPGLEREIRREFGAARFGPEIPVRKTKRQLATLRDEVIASAGRKGALIEWLARRADWDFLIAVFSETHRGGHLFWPQQQAGDAPIDLPEGALVDCYRAVDRALGNIIDVSLDGRTMLVLFSVHGMGPNRSQEHFTRHIMERVNDRFAAESGRSAPPRRPRSLMRVLRERLPARIQHAIGRAVPLSWKDGVVNRAITGGYDWAETPGLAILGSVTGYVRLNLRGRETAGMLEPGSDAHARYMRAICEAFAGCRIADTGEPLISATSLTPETFAGARSHFLPDLVVSWGDRAPVARIDSDVFGPITVHPPTGRSGNHRAEAFALVVGAESGRGHRTPRDIVDLAPMVRDWLAQAS